MEGFDLLGAESLEKIIEDVAKKAVKAEKKASKAAEISFAVTCKREADAVDDQILRVASRLLQEGKYVHLIEPDFDSEYLGDEYQRKMRLRCAGRIVRKAYEDGVIDANGKPLDPPQPPPLPGTPPKLEVLNGGKAS